MFGERLQIWQEVVDNTATCCSPTKKFLPKKNFHLKKKFPILTQKTNFLQRKHQFKGKTPKEKISYFNSKKKTIF